tara:strand:- start:554 stop:784 length:231 start_codon:yes stop_codon:yes gene_type:complete
MKIKNATKITILICLISIVILPVLARLFRLIDNETLKAFGQFALTTSAPIGVLTTGLAAGSVARHRNGNGNDHPPA